MSNIITKSLQTTVFTTVVSAALSLPANSYTINSDLIELTPQTPWSVSRAGNDSAQAYCTLSKTFKKDIILTLAENNEQNLTFALDFQKDRFIQQSEYNIILATDNGDSRSYELQPATEKAFIIRVKDDPEFYENLWKSSSLVVSVNTENYRFNTADFVGGKGDIASCLARLDDAAPKKQEEKQISGLTPEINNIPVTTITEIETNNAARIPQPPAKTVSITEPAVLKVGLQPEKLNQLSKIAAEVDVLKQENQSLKSTLSAERTSFEEKLALANQRSETASEDLLKKVALLTGQNEALQNQIRNSAKKASASATTMDEKLSAEINRLKTENNILKTSLATANTKTEKQAMETVSLSDYEEIQDKNAVLSGQVRHLTTENYKLTQLASQTTQADTEASAIIKRLTGENVALQQQVSMKDEKIAELNKALTLAQTKIRDYDTLQQQISALKTENDMLAKSYAALESASGNATPSGADTEMMALEQRYKEQSLELQRMASQMEQERQNFKLEQKRLEAMLFDPAVTEQKQLAHLAKLEEELKLANQALAEQRAMYEGGGTPTQRILPPISEMSGSERVSMMEMSKEIQRLRDEIDRLRRLSEMPRVEKAEVSEKKVILSKGTTLETATPVEEVAQQEIPEVSKPIPPQPKSVSKVLPIAPYDAPEEKVAVVEVKPMIPPPQKIQKPAPAQEATIKSYAYQDSKMALALPDPFMLNTLQKQDKSFAITKRQNGTVLWTSDQVEGSVIRKHLQGEDFETSVETMIANLKENCPAPLEVDPLVLRKGKTGNLFAYDASCGNTTLGLIFFSKDGQTLSTVSYGAPSTQKDMLDSKREKLIEALMGSMQS